MPPGPDRPEGARLIEGQVLTIDLYAGPWAGEVCALVRFDRGALECALGSRSPYLLEGCRVLLGILAEPCRPSEGAEAHVAPGAIGPPNGCGPSPPPPLLHAIAAEGAAILPAEGDLSFVTGIPMDTTRLRATPSTRAIGERLAAEDAAGSPTFAGDAVRAEVEIEAHPEPVDNPRKLDAEAPCDPTWRDLPPLL